MASNKCFNHHKRREAFGSFYLTHTMTTIVVNTSYKHTANRRKRFKNTASDHAQEREYIPSKMESTMS
jgi:hypothetical protein